MLLIVLQIFMVSYQPSLSTIEIIKTIRRTFGIYVLIKRLGGQKNCKIQRYRDQMNGLVQFWVLLCRILYLGPICRTFDMKIKMGIFTAFSFILRLN